MTLNKELTSAIDHYVNEHFREWMNQFGSLRIVGEREMEIRERIVRVEESLERQSALMRQGFEQVEKRFEQTEKRFEQMDKRFEELRGDMKTQFNRVYGFLTGLFIVVSGAFITLVIQAVR